MLNNKNNKYIWTNYEYLIEDFTVNRGESKSISIKFNKKYQPLLDANKLVFKGITVNGEEKTELNMVLN